MRRRVSESGGRRTTAGREARLGGIGGILYVVLFTPAYIVGYPDAPNRASNDQSVFDYFAEGVGTFLLFNGVLSIFALFFLVWFLGGTAWRAAKCRGRRRGRMALLRRASRGSGVHNAVVCGGGGRDRPPSDLEPLRELRAGLSTCLYDLSARLVAVPFLPGRNRGAGSRDLSASPKNRDSANLAGLGRFRGRPPRATTRPPSSARRPGRSALDSGGLGTHAHRLRRPCSRAANESRGLDSVANTKSIANIKEAAVRS